MKNFREKPRVTFVPKEEQEPLSNSNYNPWGKVRLRPDEKDDYIDGMAGELLSKREVRRMKAKVDRGDMSNDPLSDIMEDTKFLDRVFKGKK